MYRFHGVGGFLVALLLMVALTACGGTATAPDAPSESDATTEENGAADEEAAPEEDDAAGEEAAPEEDDAAGEEAAPEEGGGAGGEIESMADIPAFPGTEPLQEGENVVADMTASSLETMLGEEVTTELEAYALPEGTTWDEVKEFYEDEISDDTWTYNTEISDETSEDLKMAAWTTGGGFTAERVIMVAYVPDVMSENVGLIVGFFSE
jgi:hypothetical protein